MVKRYTIITFSCSNSNIHCVKRDVVCTKKKILDLNEELNSECRKHKFSYRIFRKDRCLYYGNHLNITSFNIHRK